MRVFTILLAALGFVAASCAARESVRVLPPPPAFWTAYDPAAATARAGRGGKALVAASLAADPATGEVRVALSVENGTRSGLSIDPALATLACAEGTGAPLALMEPADGTVPPGSGKTFILRFLPVTDPERFQRYGLPGPPSATYELPLDFALDAEGRPLGPGALRFVAPEGGMEESSGMPDLASFECVTDGEIWGELQAGHFASSGLLAETQDHEGEAGEAPEESPEPFFLLTGDEFWLDRWLVKVSPYSSGDDLFARVRIVSKTPVLLSVDLSRALFIAADGKAAPPSGLLRERDGRVGVLIEDLGAPFELGQNDRFERTLVWPGAGAAAMEGFRLRLDGLETLAGVPLFAGTLEYAPEGR
ncbi:MAG: hypothetical protein KBC36_06740 [Spirochaetia bacterium]|nr:hypothetical protein [Spirochaetia bacterium]